MINVAINGFGRIGRLAFREAITSKDINVVAVNDLSSAEELCYLLKYDTNHRRYDKEVSFDENSLIVGGKHIMVYNNPDPSSLPWKKLDIDLVFECTGFFTSLDKAKLHIDAGAKKVLISAPGKGNMKTIVYNVNDNILTNSDTIVSAASCTTNCLAPVLNLINDEFEIIKGNMTTIHAYTNDQVTLDVSHKKGISHRRGRACAMNIVPTSTGAASAIGKVIPELEGRLLGSAIRVPVSDGSLIDLVLELGRNTSIPEINNLFKNNTNETLNYTEDPIVSSDIISTTCASCVDGRLTNVLSVDNKQLVRIVAWYDNEMGYSHQMVRCAKKMLNN